MATPEEMAQKMLANVEDKTGKTLAAWQTILAKEAFGKHGQILKFLKTEHGVSHGFANLIAHETLRSSAQHQGATDLVASQYSGNKADLKPIYDKLIAAIQKFGKDVEIAPKKAYVSLRRQKQFALIKPATKTRVDVGIQLKGEPSTKRLAGCKTASMTSHLVGVEGVKAVDRELLAWLKRAYELAG